MIFVKNLKSGTNSVNKVLFGIIKINKELINEIRSILDDDTSFKQKKLKTLFKVAEELDEVKLNKMSNPYYLRKYRVVGIKKYLSEWYVILKVDTTGNWDVSFNSLSGDEITVLLNLFYSYASFKNKSKTC